MAVASSAYKKALSGESKNKQVLLKIDRVTKKFDETVAVDDVSLSIHQGEIFAAQTRLALVSPPESSVPATPACPSPKPTCRCSTSARRLHAH